MTWLEYVWAAVAAYLLVVLADQARRARRARRGRSARAAHDRARPGSTEVAGGSVIGRADDLLVVRRPIPPPTISAMPAGPPPAAGLPEGAPTAVTLPRPRSGADAATAS
jgi:hypothetical protein